MTNAEAVTSCGVESFDILHSTFVIPRSGYHAFRSSFSPTRSCGSQRMPVAVG